MENFKIIVVLGASGSGKTTFSENHAEKNNYFIICTDNYYKNLDLSKSSFKLEDYNFDHYQSIEHEKLISDVIDIHRGKNIYKCPQYSFEKHRITSYKNVEIDNYNGVIIEGIFSWLLLEEVPEIVFESFFLDIPKEELLNRIIKRDIESRGWSHDQINKRFRKVIYPMYEKFILKYKNHCTYTIK